MEIKPHLTIDEQIKKLESRGCIIDDYIQTRDTLKTINYYRLSAYFLPFKKDDDNYLEGTSFSKIINIYKFDQYISNYIFMLIGIIEVELKTKIAYYFSNKYGPLGYLDENNFSNTFNLDEFLLTIQKYKDREKNNKIIQHHLINYDDQLPLWVLVDFFSFSDISKFYTNMKTEDQKNIARTYGRNYKLISSWFFCLTHLRNSCAHFSRLYFKKFIPTPKTPSRFEYTLGNSLFDYLITVKLLLTDNESWNNDFKIKISNLIGKFKMDINLEHIGFPENWDSLLF